MQEDIEIGSLEEYVTTMLFKLQQMKLYATKIMLRVGAQDPKYYTLISIKLNGLQEIFSDELFQNYTLFMYDPREGE